MSLYDYFTRTNEARQFLVNSNTAANEAVNFNCKQYPLRSQWATSILLAVHDVDRGAYEHFTHKEKTRVAWGRAAQRDVTTTVRFFSKAFPGRPFKEAACELRRNTRWNWLSLNAKIFPRKLQLEPKFEDSRKYSPAKILRYTVVHCIVPTHRGRHINVHITSE